MESLGDKIYQALERTKMVVFKTGELYQLAYEAFYYTLNNTLPHIKDRFAFRFPIGRRADGSPMIGETSYTKEEFEHHFNLLATSELPIQGIYSLVTLLEVMMGNIIREVCLRYPQKIGTKRMISIGSALAAKTIEALQTIAIDELLHELSYKSPKDFAKHAEDIIGINLLEIPQYHRFIEFKATRDVYVQNMRITNDIYQMRAGSHSRAKTGELLPITNDYFLESYEATLSMIEMLEEKFHEIWPSDLYLSRKKSLEKLQQGEGDKVEKVDESDGDGSCQR